MTQLSSVLFDSPFYANVLWPKIMCLSKAAIVVSKGLTTVLKSCLFLFLYWVSMARRWCRLRVCVLAAAKRIGSCDATVMMTTNHYVDFPVCALHAAYLPHPPPLLSSLSILLLEAQTAAEQGSEMKNTMIVSDEQEGLRERERKESGSLRVTEQRVGERRKSEHCKGQCLVIQEHRRLWRVTAPPPNFVYICV